MYTSVINYIYILSMHIEKNVYTVFNYSACKYINKQILKNDIIITSNLKTESGTLMTEWNRFSLQVSKKSVSMAEAAIG